MGHGSGLTARHDLELRNISVRKVLSVPGPCLADLKTKGSCKYALIPSIPVRWASLRYNVRMDRRTSCGMRVAIIIMGKTGISVFGDGFGGDYWST